LARNIAAAGYKVGFLDGAKVLKVRMYEGAAETWKEWGRSLDLKDAASPAQVWSDLWLLLSVQGLPLPILLLSPLLPITSAPLLLLLALNLFLLAIRVGLLFAIAPSYQGKNQKSPHFLSLPFTFYLSPLADPLAFVRILLSSLQKPTQWRGRSYGQTS
jgi:dolichol-phosphate mannosyltransferase